MVGDPRQVTYLTHNEPKFKKYCHGQIVEFIKAECKKEFPLENIDDTTFKYSHRNNLAICQFSSKLYRKEYSESEPCSCVSCGIAGIAVRLIVLGNCEIIKLEVC